MNSLVHRVSPNLLFRLLRMIGLTWVLKGQSSLLVFLNVTRQYWYFRAGKSVTKMRPNHALEPTRKSDVD